MKWTDLKFNRNQCFITLENGVTLIGRSTYGNHFYIFEYSANNMTHEECCSILFGPIDLRDHKSLSQLLDIEVYSGVFPVSKSAQTFLQRYFELIGNNEEL